MSALVALAKFSRSKLIYNNGRCKFYSIIFKCWNVLGPWKKKKPAIIGFYFIFKLFLCQCLLQAQVVLHWDGIRVQRPQAGRPGRVAHPPKHRWMWQMLPLNTIRDRYEDPPRWLVIKTRLLKVWIYFYFLKIMVSWIFLLH